MTALRDEFAVTHDKGGFTYVSWSQVADRLDEVGEPWSFSIMQLGPDWCHGRLTIGERSYENVGYAENADAEWKKEPYKDAVSDAFKRCAALAGVARYLYDKDTPSGTGRATPPARPAAAPRPTVVRNEDPEFAPNEWDAPVALNDRNVPVDPRDGGACPTHGTPWTLKRAGSNEQTGKSWDAFWKCDGRAEDGSFCKAKSSKAWQARHEG